METTALLLVIMSAGALAGYNILLKPAQRQEWANRSAWITIGATSGAAFSLIAFSFLTGGPRLSEGWVFPVIMSGVLNIGIQYANVRARAIEDVSLVTPISATTPAIVLFTGMIAGEFPTLMGWAGIWILSAGTYVLNIGEVRQQLLEKQLAGKAKERNWKREALVYLAPLLALKKSRGVQLALLAAVLSSVSLNFDAMAAQNGNVGLAFGLIYVIVAIGNISMVIKNKEALPPSAWKGLALRAAYLGLVLAAATFLAAEAFNYALVAYVGSLKRIAIPLTILLAFILLKEKKNFKRRMIGGTIMAAGSAMIAWGG